MEQLSPVISGRINQEGGLQLCPISVNPEYAKKWNIHPSTNDFVLLCKDGKVLRNTLYRIGGMNFNLNLKDKYFQLLKYVESVYTKEFLDYSYKNKPAERSRAKAQHLESKWVILDSNGNERIEFKQFDSPYLTKDSVLYSLNGNYYNIETGEHYGSSNHALESKEFIFVNDSYNSDKSKRGIKKINKLTGTLELFPAE